MNPILTAIFNYLTSIWSTLRIAFGVFDTQTMINCAQLLTVVFLYGVINNIDAIFNRAKERIKPKPKDDDDEYEWVQVRRKQK